MNEVILNNGAAMPHIGYGVFRMTDQAACEEAEMKQIAQLDTGHTCFLPRNTGASVAAFLNQAVTGSAPSGMRTEKK